MMILGKNANTAPIPIIAGGTLCQFLGVQAMVAISAAFALSGACIVLVWMQKIKK